jgi:hypothetical protein
LGRDQGLREIAVREASASLRLESVLATSFPPPAMLDHVRILLARDAASTQDVFGLKAEKRADGICARSPPKLVILNSFQDPSGRASKLSGGSPRPTARFKLYISGSHQR